VTPAPSGARIACSRNDAHDRFEGEHPSAIWPRRSDAQARHAGYAPSKYRTKPWPSKALLEVWYSFTEVLCGFTLPVQSHGERIASTLAPYHLERPAPRDWLPRSADAENANQPPDANGENIGYVDGYALDVPFSGSG
jgi:hypothetical protein